MKETQESGKPANGPRPNLKNKDFVKWSRSESCKREDSIVSTEWHETLKRTVPFVPAYDNKPLNMVYLLSGEYGRIWQKERDEWYSNVFVPKAKEKDMQERRAKIRKEAREAKKAAEKSIKERKERKAKEAEAKAKAEAEKAEKMKAKLQKFTAAKKTAKAPKKKQSKEEPPAESAVESPAKKQETCPQGWMPAELTLQCECSGQHKENPNPERKDEQEAVAKQSEKADEGCTMCPGLVEQLKKVQDAKASEQKEESSNDAVAEELHFRAPCCSS